MATVVQDTTQDPNAQPSTPMSNGNSGTIGASNGSAGAPQSSPSASGSVGAGGANAPSSSGHFSNLQNYLNANSGYNTSGGGFSGQVAGNVNDTSNQVKQGTDSVSNAFQDQAKQAQSNYSGGLQQAQGTINQAMSDPSKIDQNASDQFGQLKNASYTGPQGLNSQAGYGQLQQQGAAATNYANNIGTEAGQQNLLNSLYGGQNYSQGDQKLDNVFLQADPNAQSTLQNAKFNALQSVNGLNQAGQNASQTASQYQAQDAKLAQDVQGALGTANTGFANTLQGEVSDANKSGQAGYQSALAAIKSNNVDPATASALGLSGPQNFARLQNLLGADPTSLLAQNAPANAGNVANANEYAQYGALSKLGGTAPTLLDPSQVSNAGTYKGFTFNNDTLNALNKQADTTYATKSKDLQDQLRQESATDYGGLAQYAKVGSNDSMHAGAPTIRDELNNQAQLELLNAKNSAGNADQYKQAQIAALNKVIGQGSQFNNYVGNSGWSDRGNDYVNVGDYQKQLAALQGGGT